MTFFNLISLCGGLALFLYGMIIMTDGLEKLSGDHLESILEKMTDNILKSVTLGALITAAVQSSSATTVIVLGLVNARIIKLRQAIGIIMGANIGTTITAHILRLSDEQLPGFMSFLKPSALAPIAAVAGIMLFYVAKKETRKDAGIMLVGFSVLFTGMFQMEAAVLPLADLPEFTKLISIFTNPILGVLMGAVITAIIQSSAASIGILQALTTTGAVTYSIALPIIMGQNIGTCIKSVLAGIGASKNAKRTAFVHVAFNVAGTLIFMTGFTIMLHTVGLPFWDDPVPKSGIANFHTIFNTVTTLIFIPFAGVLEKLAYAFIKDDGDEVAMNESLSRLDDRFLSSPSFAVHNARDAVVEMSRLALENLKRSSELVVKFDRAEFEKAREVEDVIDRLQSRINMYLLRLTQKDLTEEENLLLSEILQAVNEFERIGDHADTICECAESLSVKGINFSESAMQELECVFAAVIDAVQIAVTGYEQRDSDLPMAIEPLEAVVNMLVEALKDLHNVRLQTGLCTPDAAFPFVEILYNLDRIADHCSNIGVHLLTYSGKYPNLDRHDYLRKLNNTKTTEYQSLFDMYDEKYYGRIKAHFQ